MYQTSEIRKGLKIEMDGSPYVVVEFMFVKPGKGVPFTRTKCKNLITGAVLERTFKTGEILQAADVEESNMQYLYDDGENYMFMNTETFDQIPVPHEALGDAKNWLVEEMTARVMMYKGRTVSVEIPTFVELEVVETEPGLKGSTVTGGTKNAKVSTGASVKVPLFIEQGDWLRIDTREGTYVERVKK